MRRIENKMYRKRYKPVNEAALRNLFKCHPEIKTLSMKGKSISLPEEILHLRNIRNLHIMSDFTTIGDRLQYLGGLTSLESLTIVYSKMTGIPSEISALTKVTHISLQSNSIKEIPDFVGGLKSLELLVLFDNQITKIPDSFAQLKSLRGLYLSQNPISRISHVLHGLRNLTELEINKEYLPKEERREIEKIFSKRPNATLHMLD